ncbi:non-specific lipid-transfer protein-like [Limulus polyphemus]|uniref:Sterol carrier protein 2 n=1 Tax=Limulus polyphemus TaxID=6850 RepID=A0ABM1B5A2_LIMPO|nr:non-specific lipid-transfer protein-like [Limulus polyphemus]XP_013775098.1 non-specific lipid-transfer protein-like [Limulus polyphemus]
MSEEIPKGELPLRSLASRRVFVVGVGMTKFEKPTAVKIDYPDMVKEAVGKALDDAHIKYDDIQQACVGYVYGDSTCGQRALYEVGMTGIPIYNIHNNCSTGSSALLMASQLLKGGISDCVLALGFEKMERGSLTSKFRDRVNPMDKHIRLLSSIQVVEPAPMTAQMFGGAGLEHSKKYGTTQQHFAKIAWKNHKHSTNNPYSQFQKEYTLEEIMNSPVIFGPLTKLQCCPTSNGAAAAILVSEDFVHQHRLEKQAVEILGMEMATDIPSTFEEKSCIKLVGFDMTKKAADTLYQKTGLTPAQVDVIELHDCFSTNELITYEALGLCEIGKGGELVDSGNNTYGGKYVINPSGGLISKGHPLGATGIAQCAELCWQLRSLAEKRQVPGARIALQHNIGLGGAVVVALYALGFPQQAAVSQDRSYTFKEERDQFKSRIFFSKLKEFLSQQNDKISSQNKGTCCFHVLDGPGGSEGTWYVIVEDGKSSVSFGDNLPADCTVTIKDSDLADIALGKLNPREAFSTKKLKIKGNVGLLMKMFSHQKSVATAKL